MQTSIFIMKA